MTLSRRHLLGASLATGGLVAVGSSKALAALAVATPPQTLGPFYPLIKPLDQDADLTRVEGAQGAARGEPIEVVGRVIERDGRPVGDAMVEIWQCNAFGRYHHPSDRRDAPLDPNFQGYGRDLTDHDGAYRFATIKPPPYPASATWMRPAHIHFRVTGPGFEPLVTQMYFAGDPYLADDAVFNRIRDPAARARVVVELGPSEGGGKPDAGLARFEIVLATGA